MHVRTFASIALVQPQATYAALTKSLQSEWLFKPGAHRPKVGMRLISSNLFRAAQVCVCVCVCVYVCPPPGHTCK